MNDDLERAENSVAFARDILRPILAQAPYEWQKKLLLANIIDTLDEMISEIDLLKENESE